MKGSIRKRGNSWYYYFDVAKVDGKRKRIERRGGSTRKEACILTMVFYPYSSGRFGVGHMSC